MKIKSVIIAIITIMCCCAFTMHGYNYISQPTEIEIQISDIESRIKNSSTEFIKVESYQYPKNGIFGQPNVITLNNVEDFIKNSKTVYLDENIVYFEYTKKYITESNGVYYEYIEIYKPENVKYEIDYIENGIIYLKHDVFIYGMFLFGMMLGNALIFLCGVFIDYR